MSSNNEIVEVAGTGWTSAWNDLDFRSDDGFDIRV